MHTAENSVSSSIQLLKFDKHINAVVKRLFCQTQTILLFYRPELFTNALISSRLDYCSSLYLEISQSFLSRQQLVLIAAPPESETASHL